MSTTAPLTVAPSHPLPGVRRTAFQFALVTTSEVVLRIANLAMAVLIARQFSASTLGVYATALAVSTFAVMLADNGLQTTAIQRSSAIPTAASAVFSEVFWTKLLLLPIAVAITLCGLAVSEPGPLWLVWTFVFVRVVLQSFSQANFAMLKGMRRVPPIAVIQACHFILFASALLIVWREHGSVATLLGVAAGCQAAELVASTVYLRTLVISLRSVRLGDCTSLIHDAFPVGITATLWTLVLRSDLVILGIFVKTEQVGEYAAAQIAMIAMYLGAWLLGSLLLPELSRMKQHPAMLRAFLRRWTRWLAFTLLPAAFILMWVAPFLVRALFGAGYRASGQLLGLLAAATPFIGLNSLYLHLSIAMEDSQSHAWAYGITVVLSACGSIVLAFAFGAIGVAAGAVCREAGLFAVLFTATARAK